MPKKTNDINIDAAMMGQAQHFLDMMSGNKQPASGTKVTAMFTTKQDNYCPPNVTVGFRMSPRIFAGTFLSEHTNTIKNDPQLENFCVSVGFPGF